MMELVIVRVGEISFGTDNTFSGSRWVWFSSLSPRLNFCSTTITCKEIRYFTPYVLLPTETLPKCM